MPRSRRMRTSRRRKSRSYRRRVKRRRSRAPRRTGGWRNPLRHELKYLDTTVDGRYLGTGISPLVVPATVVGPPLRGPYAGCINAPAQGSGANERIGRQIMIRKIIGRVGLFNTVELTDGAQDTWPTTFRMMLVYDMQANGAATFDLTTFWADPTNLCSLQNLDNRDRYKILMDKQWTIAAPTEAISGLGGRTQQSKLYKFYKRVNLPVQFNAGSTPGPADISTGALWMLVLSDAGSNEAGVPSCSQFWSRVRIRYSDM